jgi:hypothetical protein
MYTSIVTILLAFHPSVLDKGESLESRTQRFTTMAQAIESTANRVTCTNQPVGCKTLHNDRYIVAGILIVQLYRESGLRKDVWEGVCLRSFDCDRGKARGPWQMQRRVSDSDEVWNSFAGTVQTNYESAAWRMITMWIGGAIRGNDPTCGFAILAGYRVCVPGYYGTDRWKLAQLIATKLRK